MYPPASDLVFPGPARSIAEAGAAVNHWGQQSSYCHQRRLQVPEWKELRHLPDDNTPALLHACPNAAPCLLQRPMHGLASTILSRRCSLFHGTKVVQANQAVGQLLHDGDCRRPSMGMTARPSLSRTPLSSPSSSPGKLILKHIMHSGPRNSKSEQIKCT